MGFSEQNWRKKILRKVLRQIVDGEHYKIRSTIDDPAILDEIREKLLQR